MGPRSLLPESWSLGLGWVLGTSAQQALCVLPGFALEASLRARLGWGVW